MIFLCFLHLAAGANVKMTASVNQPVTTVQIHMFALLVTPCVQTVFVSLVQTISTRALIGAKKMIYAMLRCITIKAPSSYNALEVILNVLLHTKNVQTI